jgi:hypothetical protein
MRFDRFHRVIVLRKTGECSAGPARSELASSCLGFSLKLDTLDASQPALTRITQLVHYGWRIAQFSHACLMPIAEFCNLLNGHSRGRGSASSSQQRPDGVKLAMRNAQALPKLHPTCPAARLRAELFQPRCEQLRAVPSGRLRAISRMTQAADFHLPPAGALNQFDFDFHREARLMAAIVPPGGPIQCCHPYRTA